MNKIRCLENYKRLKEMFKMGDRGDANYFSEKLGISNRTFYRLVKYLKEIEQLNIKYSTQTNWYYLE